MPTGFGLFQLVGSDLILIGETSLQDKEDAVKWLYRIANSGSSYILLPIYKF